MNIAGTLQSKINATQALEALTYGIRAAEAGGIYGSCAAYVTQIAEAEAVAEWRLTRGATGWELTNGRLGRLKAAKKLVAADLAAIKDRLRVAGSKRQLRLALAGA